MKNAHQLIVCLVTNPPAIQEKTCIAPLEETVNLICIFACTYKSYCSPEVLIEV